MTAASDRIVGLYQRHGAAWARARGDRLVEGAWLARFRAELPAAARVLDLGCGSGRPIARSLIAQGCQVTGIDSAPGMIALCRHDFPRQDWRVGDMRGLRLGAAFDGILAWDSFFHLDHDDQRAMFAVFRAHAAPRAALMFTTGVAHGEAIGCLGGESLYHASLDHAEYRALLAAHGFAVVAQVTEDPACEGHTVWLARCAIPPGYL